VQSLVSGEQTKQDSALIVSWESLERRNNEYRELVDKKIPANSKEIAIARSYGDLSENHEYKAAKETQGLLQRTKAELEVLLSRARGTDFSNTKTDVAGIGTVIRATDMSSNQVETFTVLGAWDSDPERGVISYLSPVGKALLGRKIGEEVEFELEGAKHRHRIEDISAYQPPVASGQPAA
jgi:transcription elongation GreA/GreB family factor